jgi:hypothetical protein
MNAYDNMDPHPPQCGKEKDMTQTNHTLTDANEETGGDFSGFHECFAPLHEHIEQRIARIKADESINAPRASETINPIIEVYGPLKQEQRTVYVTPDGQEFRKHREAIEHRLKTIVEYEFLNSPLFSDSPGGRVSLGKITDWIVNNLGQVENIKDLHEMLWKKTDE